MARCKYNVLNKKGILEPWTGSFNDDKEAQKWHDKYGVIHEAKGHHLVLIELKKGEENDD